MNLHAFVLLGLTGLCATDFTPPVVNISLDVSPEERWLPLTYIFDINYLRETAAKIIDTTVPKWVHHAITPIVEGLEKYIPQPYVKEIQGMASFYGAGIADIVLLNFAYEITAFCTSVVAQDTKGHLYHGRNLDYPHVDILRNLTIDILFIKYGEVAFRGTSFAGYIGLWTGQKAKKFTISGNERSQGHWWENVISAFLLKSSPVSWLVRETLEEAEDFQDAVIRLSKVPIITDVYYIVAGVWPAEGVVVTRNRRGPADIWSLDTLHGKWYRVETNYDHWIPPPHGDDRRTPTMTALNATGQENIDLDTMYQVMSGTPTCNGITVYTTVMSAVTPEKYKTVVREKCHHK
ncbi:N-acylethanolamine-hydrolyzing acid amidase-like isoform X1 [Megalops cyprinoides]|uniref:N-acylethanolamine-hydrolyzing acid amidase-like isoform X1 n=1 Tax=Megalops cyprinoides TaxID=118141 RepID=UPI001864178E|nr:N-acylethanolamine-hydrolyzing acid amidase-like isoform X1 [Megalops cyprinoides]